MPRNDVKVRKNKTEETQKNKMFGQAVIASFVTLIDGKGETLLKLHVTEKDIPTLLAYHKKQQEPAQNAGLDLPPVYMHFEYGCGTREHSNSINEKLNAQWPDTWLVTN